ncbi:hypothetical protein SBV1_920001 [Verrucomicrobia bacterium]|nr:hypothetical protein SBV1_920001 [Verrucomicrobiota bacterium]
MQSKTAFLYEGWNLIAELNVLSTPTLVRSYVWGLDLSGEPQGAGGVGGLLDVTYVGAQTTNCFVAFDGNGNVAGLVSATNAAVAAQYEYGPFAEVIRATGPIAKANPFRFSTKYQDDETDLLYYGYRYYSASTGRWLSLDPAADDREANDLGFRDWTERGNNFDYQYYQSDFTPLSFPGLGGYQILESAGANHYLYVANNPMTAIDPSGLWTVDTRFDTCLCPCLVNCTLVKFYGKNAHRIPGTTWIFEVIVTEYFCTDCLDRTWTKTSSKPVIFYKPGKSIPPTKRPPKDKHYYILVNCRLVE